MDEHNGAELKKFLTSLGAPTVQVLARAIVRHSTLPVEDQEKVWRRLTSEFPDASACLKVEFQGEVWALRLGECGSTYDATESLLDLRQRLTETEYRRLAGMIGDLMKCGKMAYEVMLGTRVEAFKRLQPYLPDTFNPAHLGVDEKRLVRFVGPDLQNERSNTWEPQVGVLLERLT